MDECKPLPVTISSVCTRTDSCTQMTAGGALTPWSRVRRAIANRGGEMQRQREARRGKAYDAASTRYEH